MNKQRGYYNTDLGGLLFLAVMGCIACLLILFVGIPYGLWWLWENFDIVRVVR